MPALRSTSFLGEIVFLGVLRPTDGAVSTAVDRLELTFDGAAGDARSAALATSDARGTDQHPIGTRIANARQLYILSEEELAEMAFALRVPAVAPEWLAASVVLRGLPDLTHLPPSSRLQGPDGATLVVDLENRAAPEAAAAIEAAHPGVGARFLPAAQRRGGVAAWVERPGALEIGQTLRLHIPDQRAWEKMSDVRG